jgi:hypothetical protein
MLTYSYVRKRTLLEDENNTQIPLDSRKYAVFSKK